MSKPGGGEASSSTSAPGAPSAQERPTDRAIIRPRAVLLDFHNTLAVVGSIEAWVDEATERVADGPGAQAIPLERIRNVWGDARKLFPTLDWDLDPVTHRHAFVSTLSRDGVISMDLAEAPYTTMPDQWVLNDGAADFLAQASGAGMRLAIVSNIALDIRPALERWGIASALDAVILSYEVGYVKPDPQIFQLAADSLDVAATDCLMIGDSPYDDTGGAVLGMQCLIARPDQTWRAFALASSNSLSAASEAASPNPSRTLAH